MIKPIDFVFPDNNEEKFIEIAKKLGYKELCFIYNKPINKKLGEKDLKVSIGTLTKKQADYILVKSTENNQPILERGRFNILYNTEKTLLNQVECRFAKKNNISFAFSFGSILKNKNLMAKIKKNLRLCRKYENDVIFASFTKNPYEMRSPIDLKSLLNIISR